MNIRKSTLDDLDSIMEVLADGRTHLATLGVEQWQGYYPQEDVIISDIERNESFVVVDEEGKLLATAMLGLHGEDDYHSIHHGMWLTSGATEPIPYAVLHRVAVCKQARGSGVSVFLITELEKKASEAGRQSVRVDTHPRNLPMRKLLDKNGYSECGIVLISHAEEFDPRRVAYEKVLY